MCPLPDDSPTPRPAVPDRPLVDVVKSDWLPASETFLRTQTGALTRWRYRCVGFRRVESPLADAGDVLVGDLDGLRDLWTSAPPDLVHVHWATEAIPLLPLIDERGLPLVVTTHGMDVGRRRHSTGVDAETHREQVRRVLSAADAVVAPSHYLASRAVAAGAPPERVRVRYIGVPVPADPGRGGGVDVAVVARLVPVKGVEDVIRACELAAVRLGRRVCVAVAGDGPDRERIADVARELRGVDLQLRGRLSHEEVFALIGDARLVAGGSLVDDDGAREGFGLGLLEASSLGRPVVAYDSGGVAEAVLHEVTGLLVAEGDVSALGGAVARVLGDSDLGRRLGAAGRRRVVAGFDVREQTRGLEALYDEIVG